MVGFPKYESYKDSGVEWLGEIPSHWDVKKLKFMVRIKNGQDYKAFEVQEPGYPVIGSGGRFAYASKYLFEGESVLLGRKGTIDKPLYVNGAFWTVDTMFYSKIYNNTFPKFFYYCASTIPFGYYSTNTAVPSMTQEALGNHTFTYPPIEEQKKIVEFLDRKTAEIDQAIAQKQRLIELLQEQKAILINQAVTKGLDPNVPMCDRGIEWLGEIPTHWQLDKVKHLTTKVGSGITPRGGGENYIDEGVLFIRSQNVYFDELRLDDAVYISEKTHNLMSNTSVWVGDVLLNITGASIGRNCVFRGESSKANVNQHVCIIRPNLKIRPWYLSYLFESRLGQEQIWLSQNGASREGLNFADLKTFVFPLPTIEEQKEIEKEIFKILETIKGTINSIEKEKKALREFGSCLITSAVTGKIKV